MLRRSPLLLVALLTIGLASLPPRMSHQDEPAAEKAKAKEKEKEKAKPKEAEDEKPVVTHHEVRIGEKVAEVHGDGRPDADARRRGEARGADLLHRLHGRRLAGDAQTPAADVLVQRRARLVVGLAAPRRARAEAGRACPTTAAIPRAAVPAGRQRASPGSTGPTSSSSTRSAPATAAPAKPELNKKFHGLRGRHRTRWASSSGCT